MLAAVDRGARAGARQLPIDALRLVVGALLLVFGLQWLRKAILRASGYKALHDEEEAFREEREQAARRGADRAAGIDWYAFTVAFKGVLLEGLEVAFIVITFGADARSHSASPPPARPRRVVVVVVAGSLVRGPLARVPENTIKFAVGLLLTTFGIFWAAEGAGVDWPGDELALLGVLAFVGARLVRPRARPAPPAPLRSAGWSRRMSYVARSAASGGTSSSATTGVVAAAVGLGLVLTGILTGLGIDAWWLLPVVVALALAGSLRRATRATVT